MRISAVGRVQRMTVAGRRGAAVSLLVILNARLRSVLPAKTPMRPAARRAAETLVGKNRTGCSAGSQVIGPVRHRITVVDALKTCAAGPGSDIGRRDLIQNIVLYRRSDRDQVALHTVKVSLLCQIIALRPTD